MGDGTAIRFVDEVLKRLPFRVHVVQTDNGAECQSQFHWHLESRDIRHVYIRPRTLWLNGKVERSHRVDDQEFRWSVTDVLRPYSYRCHGNGPSKIGGAARI